MNTRRISSGITNNKPGVDKSRRQLTVDWNKLQRPGFSPDYLNERYERFDLAFEKSDWIPTAAAEALIRNNRPLLAYLGGKSARFTSKDHIFYPGDLVDKQLVLINNSRRPVECNWSLSPASLTAKTAKASVPPGERQFIPLQFKVPDDALPGSHTLQVKVTFSDGQVQEDTFQVQVIARPSAPKVSTKIALFDPPGETAALLKGMGIKHQAVSSSDDLTPFDLLIIGKGALTPAGAAPKIARVRDGLRVLMFEQSSEALEQRFGFRTQEYGLRQCFPRVPDHPVLTGLSRELLSDWRGDATLFPPRLKYEIRPQLGPTVTWCGLTVPRLWRCGNQGNVASVLIEKPARGDFLPLVDGGFSLQYSPLLEYCEGQGLIVFCQLDVTGRTEAEPAAETLVHNLLQYTSAWQPPPRRQPVYAGDAAGDKYLQSLGIAARPFGDGKLSKTDTLIVGPGGGRQLKEHKSAIEEWLKKEGRLCGIGLDQSDVDALLPRKVKLRSGEHIAAYFASPAMKSPLAGIGPADVHNRDPREMPLVTDGADVVGDGVLATVEPANIVLCQVAPWQFEGEQHNLRKTRRHYAFLISRLLGNLGVGADTPLLERFQSPVTAKPPEQRWLEGFYLDRPVEWDDPYRHFRW